MSTSGAAPGTSTSGTPEPRTVGRFAGAPAGLVMIGLDGPAPVCAAGMCATPDDELGSGTAR